MYESEKIIFSDYIKNNYETLLNIKNVIYELQSKINEGIIVDSNLEFSNLINTKIKLNVNKVEEDLNKIINWLNDYIKNMDVLSKGFLTNQNSDVIIQEFENIRNILEGDLLYEK